jgi:hypothetical protein
MRHMFANKEVAARHLPVAHGRDSRDARDAKVDRSRGPQPETRRPSETRLQAAVVPERNRDDGDLYADVPCTD